MIHTEKVASVPWESRVCQGTGGIYTKKTVTVFPSLAASEREFPLKWGIFEKKRQKNFGDETNMKTFEKNLKIRFIESPYLCAIV
jgi:hypothetical protein